MTVSERGLLLSPARILPMTDPVWTTLRQVPLDRLEEYIEAFGHLRRECERAGGQARLLRDRDREDCFLEWIEAATDWVPREPAPVLEARRGLDDLFEPERPGAWEDVTDRGRELV